MFWRFRILVPAVAVLTMPHAHRSLSEMELISAPVNRDILAVNVKLVFHFFVD